MRRSFLSILAWIDRRVARRTAQCSAVRRQQKCVDRESGKTYIHRAIAAYVDMGQEGMGSRLLVLSQERCTTRPCRREGPHQAKRTI